MVLGAFAVFIIERQLQRAAVTAFIGAALAWIGLIHGAQLGWGAAPMVALGYALMGVICLVARFQAPDRGTTA
jgi:AGZA family xanthine/uracil permease-like MFS transporter